MLTESEIQSIGKNVGMSEHYVRHTVSSHETYDAKSIKNLCLDYRSRTLDKLFGHDEMKTCFWTNTAVPLEKFANPEYQLTERQILSLRKLTNESIERLKEYFKDVPKGYQDLHIQYLHLKRQAYLVKFGFSKEVAESLCMRNECIDNIVTDNLHLLQADITEQQEHSSVQTCREVDKLVQDIQAIQCPDHFDDFVRVLIDVFSKIDSVAAMTKVSNDYKNSNRSQVYFWDDIVLLHQKSSVCATRLAKLFKVGSTEFDTDRLMYMRTVLDVCHRQTTTDWDHINAYLKPSQGSVSGGMFVGSAQDTAQNINGATCVYAPARLCAAPSAHVLLHRAPVVLQVWQPRVYACVPRMP
jgi:hypothetical protein